MTSQDFTAALNAAARCKMQYGATPAQIAYIVRLHNDEFDPRDVPSTLTKKQASGWIDRLLNPVVIPKFDAEEHAAREAEIKTAAAAYADHEERKAAWIAEHYPDYATRSSKSRKRIRHAANKAVAV